MVACAIWLDSTSCWNRYWLSTSPWVSIRSRKSINRMIPPKIAIHTIQVRGGTRNSPHFLGAFSSSLCLFSSGIFCNGCANLACLALGRNAQLNPLPTPLQATNRRWCKLESFRNPHSFHPKYFSALGSRHDQLMAAAPLDLLIGEKVLQFD